MEFVKKYKIIIISVTSVALIALIGGIVLHGKKSTPVEVDSQLCPCPFWETDESGEYRRDYAATSLYKALDGIYPEDETEEDIVYEEEEYAIEF